MIITFTYTIEAFVRRAKSVTRRNWAEGTVRHARAAQRRGDVVDAWDRSPRVGGRKIGELRILEYPARQCLADFPDADWEAEGFAFYEAHPDLAHPKVRAALRLPRAEALQALYGVDLHTALTVIRFEVLSVVAANLA